MNILVIGGAGFIGSNFLYYLNQNYPSYKLFCIDKLSYAGNINNIEALVNSNKVTFQRGDICDEQFLESYFDKNPIDIVVNFAAESHVDRSIEEPSIFLRTNYFGVFNILTQLRKRSSIRFHQVSTDEVYGDLPIDRPELKFDEKNRFKPSSPYAATKAAADLLIMSYYRTYNLKVSISHASNNYGPFQFPEKLIPLVISRALDDLSVPIYGDGRNIRDWLYVEDHCSAIMSIVEFGRIGESYNIGGNMELSNIVLVKSILDKLNKTHDLISYVEDRVGHDQRYALNIEKINNEIGWQPKYDFEYGIKLTIDWYKKNQAWIKSVQNQDYIDYFRRRYER